MKSEFNRTVTFEMGDYSAGRGIRRYPYSTNLTANPQPYGMIRMPGYGGVHAIGSVWASILYEVYWNAVEEEPFDPDWFHGFGGNTILLQDVVDGLKLQPCRPSFVDARNAIIAANVINQEGRFVCAYWHAFAKRGLGFSARTGGNEGFDLPPECI